MKDENAKDAVNSKAEKTLIFHFRSEEYDTFKALGWRKREVGEEMKERKKWK